MRRLTRIPLTTKLVGLSSGLILLVAGILTVALVNSSSQNLERQTMQMQQVALRVLANTFRMDGNDIRLRFGPDGALADAIWDDIPEAVTDHALIDLVGQLTGTTATLFAWDAGQGEFVRRTTNIKAADGARAVGTVLGSAGPVHAAMLRGQTYSGEATILGNPYLTIYHPIRSEAGQINGLFYVGIPRAALDAAMRQALNEALMVTAALVLLGSLAAWFCVKSALRPLRQVTSAVAEIGARNYTVDVPGQALNDEIGAVARNLATFRDQLAEAAAQERQAERRRAEQERVVRDLTSGLGRLSRGDLTGGIESPADDPFPAEYETLRLTFNELVSSLNTMVLTITESAQGVRSGADEIAQVSQDLSSRAETQAATLEQSAAALNQLTESVRATAEKAAQADRATIENRREAEAGGAVVREAVTAMRQIEKSSEQITRIIGVIDDISFQTNLLALNAGVEAARAGEAGRGFAVVASEVRALAQRASGSAKEIKDLISQSSQQVEEGSALVSRTGSSLEDILRRVSEVSALVSEIAAAATEQAKGLAEVNTGVTQIDVVTQQNAAVAEESTAAASSLLSEAQQLAQALSGFRTSGGKPATPARAAPVTQLRHAPQPQPQRAAAAGGGGAGWSDF
ncbi:methyl-accepting chemotaxis protein [Halodurantibacterium flavum]|uniref:Methyl-accepting chemotaxis protein n=1 Tax=Halodurantibacterium flavum TaxID=1382802 RepID=A0ABW4S840_9RHOB